MYESLAAAVLVQAVEDLNRAVQGKWPRACSYQKRGRAANIIKSAKEFLLEPNDDLEFWCVLGGFDMRAIIEKSKQIADGSILISDEVFKLVIQKQL